MQIKLENILIIIVMIIGLYLFMDSRRYNRSYFTIGNDALTWCYSLPETSCSDSGHCNWDKDKCHVIQCSKYNDHRGACNNEVKCKHVISGFDDEGDPLTYRCALAPAPASAHRVRYEL